MRTLLIANRGEIARRVARSARALGLRVAAVYTEPDLAAPHAREADVALPVGSYLDVDEIVDAAARAGADAVHPGYGFLSERAPAARAIEQAGLVWVGPPPGVIEALGDKVRAKELMAAAGVPLLPGGPVTAPEELAAIGYPLLIKAAAGGGGRGMRLVVGPAELSAAVDGASREALAAFGDGTVFAERWLPAPRHVEVQIVADRHGTVLHLGERECSIQRRHQKVLEEAPAPSLPPGLRELLTDAAVAGARAVSYVGAGTWEFLVDGADFYFLEVNTRLQVEHPVTEAITGVDLVRLQLRVAAGEPLGLVQADVRFSGHAVEGRVVAEDPAAGWLPSVGVVERWEPGLAGSAFEPRAGGVRYDSGVESGSAVVADYDSLLGKVIAHGASRGEAAARLGDALDRLEIQGVATNRALLAGICREPSFLAGETSTTYLAEHEELQAPGPPPSAHLVAAALWAQAERRRRAVVLRTLPSGFRNLPSQDQRVTWRVGAAEVPVGYRLRGDRFHAVVAGTLLEGRLLETGAEVIDVEIAGIRRRYRIAAGRSSLLVAGDGAQVECSEVPRFPEPGAALGSGRGPTAPVPGTVVKVEVMAGDHVVAGQTLVVLEAMKLEHRICAEVDGIVVEVPVTAGDKVDAHQLLAVVEAV